MRDKDTILLENAYDDVYNQSLDTIERDRSLIPDDESGSRISSLNKKLKRIEESGQLVYLIPLKDIYKNEFGNLRKLQPVGPYEISLEENQKNYGLYFFKFNYVGNREIPQGLLNPDIPLEFIAPKNFGGVTAKDISNIFRNSKKSWSIYLGEDMSEGIIMNKAVDGEENY